MTRELKNIIARNGTSKTDKILLVLQTQNMPLKLKEIKDMGLKLGFREIKSINVAAHLNGTKGKATLLPEGWELTEDGKIYLQKKYNIGAESALTPILSKVEQYVSGIPEKETKEFLNEAIECANRKLYRAAVVLSWIGAVSVLHHYVFKNYLQEFNKEAAGRGFIKSPIKNQDGFATIKENDFLQILEKISVISNDVKKELIVCLGRRNSCGHPNNIKMQESTVAAHLDNLILYVFGKFRT